MSVPKRGAHPVRRTSVIVAASNRQSTTMFWPPTRWPLPPLNGWNMAVGKWKGHTRVTLDTPVWKGDEGHRLRCYSSVIEGRLLVPDQWSDGVADRIANRLEDNQGGQKGRVLYLGRSVGLAERVPLAVAAWHLPPAGELELLELDVATMVREERASWVPHLAATLMDALRTVASHKHVNRPADRLAWVTDDIEVARRAHNEWSFNGLRPEARPAHTSASFYLRRIEN